MRLQPYLVEQEGVERTSQRLHQRHDLARGGEADPAVHRHRPCEVRVRVRVRVRGSVKELDLGAVDG